MSSFLEHVEFLMGPSRDHSGDRVLDRWESCVRVFAWCAKYISGTDLDATGVVSKSQIEVSSPLSIISAELIPVA
jgi:hypothetical protein